MTKAQRQIIVASAIEFSGIVALATRFGADRGGPTLLVIGIVSVLIGLGWQIRTLVRASNQQAASGVARDV